MSAWLAGVLGGSLGWCCSFPSREDLGEGATELVLVEKISILHTTHNLPYCLFFALLSYRTTR